MNPASNYLTGWAIEKLIDACRGAGSAILDVYSSPFDVFEKEDRSPLTEADRRSHDILAAFLRSESPYPVLSEEGREIPYAERKKWDTFWLVDPLDGTKEFIKRNDEFTVNVALISGNRPAAGFIFVPVREAFYYAVSGQGSYKISNEGIQKLPVGQPNATPAVIGSRSHRSPELDQFIKRMEKKSGPLNFVPAGSSLKFCLVAEGIADLYPRLGPTMEWDTAAGQIIVEEAGGKVLDVSTRAPLVYNKASLLNPNFVALREETSPAW